MWEEGIKKKKEKKSLSLFDINHLAAFPPLTIATNSGDRNIVEYAVNNEHWQLSFSPLEPTEPSFIGSAGSKEVLTENRSTIKDVKETLVGEREEKKEELAKKKERERKPVDEYFNSDKE